MTKKIVYLNQLIGADFNYLKKLDFHVAVIDHDDSRLTKEQIKELQAQGKKLIAYQSIGEAESYRDYFKPEWLLSRPSFLLQENPDWLGNFPVKFWEPEWKDIVKTRMTNHAKMGYDGSLLDVVDAYTVPEVQAAYNGTDIRQDMRQFVQELSQTAKAVSPSFKMVPQNAVELLGTYPDDPSQPAGNYLDAIDGISVESAWTLNNQRSPDTAYVKNYIGVARDKCKQVLSVEYATSESLQKYYVKEAIASECIPFVTTPALAGAIPSINYAIPRQISSALVQFQGQNNSYCDPYSPSSNASSASFTAPILLGAYVIGRLAHRVFSPFFRGQNAASHEQPEPQERTSHRLDIPRTETAPSSSTERHRIPVGKYTVQIAHEENEAKASPRAASFGR